MAQKKEPFREKLARTIRGLKRGFRAFMSAGSTLSHEKNNAVLKGANKDIRTLRGLDLEIGALLAPFNGVARVPEKVTAEIDKHVKDVADSFSRVAAVRMEVTDSFEDLVQGRLEKESPLRSLEYINTYKSAAGNTIEQRLLKTALG